MTNPTGELDDVVHHRHRLGILTIAAEATEVEFSFLRDTLDLTPGNLNRHLAVLEAANLVAIRKEFQGRRPKTWVAVTRAGRSALQREMAALHTLVVRHQAIAKGRPARRESTA